MSHTRWRRGAINAVFTPVEADTVIESGDLLYQHFDVARPASKIQTLGRQRRTFAVHFLGVAMQSSPRGQSEPIRVATTGVFEFDFARSSFRLGQWVGPALGWTPEATVLANQRVETVVDRNHAIARVANGVAIPAGSVLIAICSTVMTGGVAGTTAAA
jgi:hypothetical protein